MKILSANNSNKFDFSPKDWRRIRKAQGEPGGVNDQIGDLSQMPSTEPEEKDDDTKYYESLEGLSVSQSDATEDHDSSSHVERSYSSPWGGREVYDGEEIIRGYRGTLSGTLFVPTELLQGEVKDNVQARLQEDIKEYIHEEMIPELTNELQSEVFMDSEEEQEVESVDVTVRSLAPVVPGGNEYQIVFEVDVETRGFLSASVLQERYEEAKAEARWEAMNER
jgi:hypothetical protein